jgi:Tol biopolymer transport system component
MKRMRLIATFAAIAACSAVIASQTPSGHAVFEQALAKERVEGNLREAIRLYERVVAEFPSDRALTARALQQTGLCHEKLGNQAGARAAYERLQREYGDQVQIAGEAKTRLAALPREDTAPSPRVKPLPITKALFSVSWDGTQAVVADMSKGTNLAIADLATGQSRLLTNFDWTSSWASEGRWSRDGRHVAYLQGNASGPTAPMELRVATLDGRARTIPRKDAASGRGMTLTDWLPDGSAIMTAIERPDGTWAIGLIAIADGTFTQLRTLGWDVTWRDNPRLSPDGRFVAFVERTSGQGDIHVLSVDGRQTFRIEHPADDAQPIWSPDGRQLAFISNRFGSDALWTVTMEDGQAKGEPVKLKDGMNGMLVDWPRRGLVYTQGERSRDVYTISMDPATNRSTGSPRPVLYKRSGWNISPAWSPDGKSLAFFSGSLSDLNSRYLVVMPSSGAAREFPIPPNGYKNLYDIRWFGNGRGLGVSGVDAKGQALIFRLSLPSGEWTTIPREGSAYAGIEWNEDGTAFYFVRTRQAERNGVFRKSVEDGREELVYPLPTTDTYTFNLEISPDRHWLAFNQKGINVAEVVVVHLVSGERRTVASLTAKSPSDKNLLNFSGWFPDGRVLVQQRASWAEPAAKWLLVPPDGGAAQPWSIGLPASTTELPSYPLVKWSPDGSSIAFVHDAGSSRLFIFENPLADLPAARIGATRR